MTVPRFQVEFVGGPWDGTGRELDDLPDELVVPTGRYARSVRCADDGAMRYVWRPTMGIPDQQDHERQERTWRTGS